MNRACSIDEMKSKAPILHMAPRGWNPTSMSSLFTSTSGTKAVHRGPEQVWSPPVLGSVQNHSKKQPLSRRAYKSKQKGETEASACTRSCSRSLTELGLERRYPQS